MQISLFKGRTTEQKQALYARIAEQENSDLFSCRRWRFYMAQAIEKTIAYRIRGSGGGWPFSPRYLLDLGSWSTVDSALHRLERKAASAKSSGGSTIIRASARCSASNSVLMSSKCPEPWRGSSVGPFSPKAWSDSRPLLTALLRPLQAGWQLRQRRRPGRSRSASDCGRVQRAVLLFFLGALRSGPAGLVQARSVTV